MSSPALRSKPAPAPRIGGTKLHGWRKLAGSFWGSPNDPQFYGDLELDAGTLLEHLHQVREETGAHVTMTHAVGRAVAHGLEAVPDLRVRLARGREYPRESTDVFFIVAAEGGSSPDARWTGRTRSPSSRSLRSSDPRGRPSAAGTTTRSGRRRGCWTSFLAGCCELP